MSKRRLRILVFHLAFFYSGGGEKLVLEEVKELRERGHKVDFFTPSLDKKLCYPDLISDFGIKELFPFLTNLFPKHESLKILFTCILFPFIAFKFSNYDVVFGANQPGAWFGWLIKKFTKTPYAIYLAQPTRILYPRRVDKKVGVWVKEETRMFPLIVKLIRPAIKFIDRVSIGGADKIMANGEYIANRLEETYGVKPIVVPAGANVLRRLVKQRFEGYLRANGFRIRKPYILLSNRHFPQKRFDYAICAMPRILEKFPDVKLIVTGNATEYTKELIGLVRELGVEESVVFTNYVKESDMSKLYSNAAVYIYTSPEEDFGMGVIEAMASGVPVVGWRSGGPSKTIIDGKSGFLIRPYKRFEFTSRVIELLTDRAKNEKMGEYAREHVRDKYTYKIHNDMLESEILKSVS